MTWRILLTETAAEMLGDIADRRVREQIRDRVDRLEQDPEPQGKPLYGELAGLRSVRAAGQRFRVIYRVVPSDKTVVILAVGLRREGDRKDIYLLARKLVRLGLLGRD